MKRSGEITQEIYAQMKSGRREAFNRFFERCTARVLVYINYNMSRRLRRKLEPTDVLQNIYLKICKDFEAFCSKVEQRSLHKVMIRMADHELTEAYRYHFKVDKRDANREVTAAFLSASPEDGLSPLDWVPSDDTSVTARVVREDEYRRIMQLLSTLSATEQLITVKRIIEGVPTKEIAAQVGKSRGAVQMIVARVRDKLRELALEGEHHRENPSGRSSL